MSAIFTSICQRAPPWSTSHNCHNKQRQIACEVTPTMPMWQPLGSRPRSRPARYVWMAGICRERGGRAQSESQRQRRAERRPGSVDEACMLAVTRLGGEGAEASDDRGLLFGRGLRLELEDDDMDVGRHAGAAAGVPGRAAPVGNGRG